MTWDVALGLSEQTTTSESMILFGTSKSLALILWNAETTVDSGSRVWACIAADPSATVITEICPFEKEIGTTTSTIILLLRYFRNEAMQLA